MATKDNFIDAKNAVEQLNEAFNKHKEAVSGAVTEMSKLVGEYQKLPSQFKKIIELLEKNNEPIKGTRKALSEQEKLMRQVVAERERLALATSKENQELQKLRAEKAKLNAEYRKEAKTQQEQNTLSQQAGNYYEQLRIRIARLTQEYQNLAAKKAITGSLTEKEEKRMANLSARLDNYGKTVQRINGATGKAASGFDGLRWQTQQLVREIPAAAYGINVFFGAISNNLPMFIDEIEKAKLANKELLAEGKKAPSIVGRVAGAFLDWRTGLVLVITALTMFSKDIVKAIKGANSFADAKKRYTDGLGEALSGQIGEIVILEKLGGILNDVTKSTITRTKAMAVLQNMYPDQLSNLRIENDLLEENGNLIKNVADQLEYQAKKQLALDLLKEPFKEMFEAERRLNENRLNFIQWMELAQSRIDPRNPLYALETTDARMALLNDKLKEATEAYENQKDILSEKLDVDKEIEKIIEKQNSALKQQEDLYNLINFRLDQAINKNKSIADDESILYASRLKAAQKFIDESTAKENTRYQKEIRALYKRMLLGEKVSSLIELAQEQHQDNMAKITKEGGELLLSIERHYQDQNWDGYVKFTEAVITRRKEINREIADDESVVHIERLKRLQSWNNAQLEFLELEWKDKRRAAEIEIQDKKASVLILEAIDVEYYNNVRKHLREFAKDRKAIIDDEFEKRYGAFYDLVIQRVEQRIDKEKELAENQKLTIEERQTYLNAQIAQEMVLLKLQYDEAVRLAEKEIAEKQKSKDILTKLEEQYTLELLKLTVKRAKGLSKIDDDKFREELNKYNLMLAEQEAELREHLSDQTALYLEQGNNTREIDRKIVLEQREILKEKLKNDIEYCKKQLAVYVLTAEQRIELLKKIAEAQEQLNEINLDELGEKEQAWAKKVSDVFSTLQLGEISGDTLADFFSLLHDGLDETMGKWEKLGAVAQTVGEIMVGVVRTVAKHQSEHFRQQLSNLELQKEIEIQFAGESEAAREQIEKRFEEKKNRIRTEQAKKEKQFALMQATINLATAIIKALPVIPLMAAAAAIGAAQIAIIQSTPIPEFEKGVKDFEGGLAKINEKRDEVVTTPDGKIFKPKGRNLYVNLPKGTNVYPSEQAFYQELNGVLGANNIMPIITQTDNYGITKEEMEVIMRRTLAKQNVQNITLDKNGFATHLINKHSQINILNNRVTFKGKDV